ncbi:MAG: hypothetical protein ACJ74W_06745 [Pyrinomonadaceae bacterium]
MIPVKMLPKPSDFNEKVRKPGQKFLSTASRPIKEKDWKGKEYWRKVIPELREGHRHICAYAALWISKLTGSPTVDHYIPKKDDPDSAYEWENFRLSCLTMNSRKKHFRDVLDPFEIKDGWFTIDFSTFVIHPNPTLPVSIKKQVDATIKRLKLNTDEMCIAVRREWFECFETGCMNFKLLEERAPFIAYEARRQGLVR